MDALWYTFIILFQKSKCNVFFIKLQTDGLNRAFFLNLIEMLKKTIKFINLNQQTDGLQHCEKGSFLVFNRKNFFF